MTFVYIKENSQEGLLIADSQGGDYDKYGEFCKKLWDETGISSYVIERNWQSDQYSCHAIALKIAIDVMMRDEATNKFYVADLIPNLIKLQSKEQKYIYFILTFLPAKLLKTCQTASAIHPTINIMEEKIKGEERVKEYHKRFSEEIYKDWFINSYPKQKGLKFVKIVETQYYINQMKKIFENISKDVWKNIRNEFCVIAKAFFKENEGNKNIHEDFYKLATDFTLKKTTDYNIQLELEHFRLNK